MNLPAFSVRRPVTTIMIYLFVSLIGVIAWSRLPQELYPEVTYPQLTVVTRYQDAAPEEIELLVTKPIEEVTGTVSGLRQISSISKEELSLVIAEFSWGTNMDFAGLGVREKLDLIKERLPRGSEEPVVIKYNPFELPVVVLNLSGDRPPHELLRIARKQVKNEIEKVEGVAAVNLSGGIEREILVEVDQGRLQASGLPISHVVDALTQANLNYPAGTIKEAFYEYLIRTIGEFQVVPEISGIAVGVDEEEEDPQEKLLRSRERGPLRREKGVGPRQRLILLRDIATVKDTFREPESISRFNGEDNVSLSIQKQAGANTLQVAERIREAMKEIIPALPPGLQLRIAVDQSVAIKNSIAGVRSSAILGGMLVFLVLYFFLGSVLAALNVTIVIPISILGTFVLMYFGGITVNMISLVGLVVGIGLLVDASIVVVENIARHREEGKSPKEAAVQATQEVASAIVAGVLTTIVVFLPTVFVGGVFGQLFKQFALTVVFSLSISLVVALTLTSLFASRIPGSGQESPIEPVIELFRRMDLGLVKRFLRYRWMGIGVVLMLFAGAVLLLVPMNRELLPRVDQGQFTLKVNLPPGTRLVVTDRVSQRIEQVLQRAPEVQDVTVRIGSSKERRAEELLQTLGSHQAEIFVNLKPRYRGWGVPSQEGFRIISSAELVQRFKKNLDAMNLEGAELNYILRESPFQGAFQAGNPVVVEVQGHDLDRLNQIADRVQEMLKTVPGLYGVQTDRIPPSPETKVYVMKDRAATYHLSVSDIALTAQTALKGYVASKFKEQGKEVDIRVRLRPQDRRDMNKVRRLLIHSPLELDVPLAEVAYFAVGMGPTEIRRKDQQRTILVSAQLFQRPLSDALREVRLLLDQIRVPSEYSVKLTGESERMQESYRQFLFALILSLFLVYMVMASEFESLWQPLLIMGTIPMALIGIVLALGATLTPLSVMVGFGGIVLVGIVVNNGIVLIDFVNLLRSQGMDLEEAVVLASRTRLRPIVMTAITTVIGMLPLALQLAQGVEVLSPMAITVMGGMIASTFLTLIFLPTIYVVGARFFEWLRSSTVAMFAPTPALAGAGAGGGVISEIESSDLKKSPRDEGEGEEPPSEPPSGGGGGGPAPEPPPLQVFPPEAKPSVSESEIPPYEPYHPTLPQEQEPGGGSQGMEEPEVEGSEEQEVERSEGTEEPPEFPEIPKDYGSEEAAPQIGELPSILPGIGLTTPPQKGQGEPPAETDKAPEKETKEQETKEREAQEQAAREQEAKEREAQEQAAREQEANPRQKKLLVHLKAKGRITRKAYVKLARTSVPTAARDLKELVDRGLIKGVGPLAKGRYYVLS